MNLNDLDPSTPNVGSSTFALLQSVQELKALLKTVLLVAHEPDGRLRKDAISGVGSGTIGTDQLINASVTTSKLADDVIETIKIKDGAVTTAKLANNAVDEEKFANDSIPTRAYKTNSIPLEALNALIGRTQLSSSSSDDAIRAVTSDAIANEAVVDRCIQSMSLAKLTGGNDLDLMMKVGDTWAPVPITGSLAFDSALGAFVVSSDLKIAIVAEPQPRGVNGGTGIANDWNMRLLTEVTDNDNIISINSGAFKLNKGKYMIMLSAPACNVGHHQVRIYNELTNEPIAWGSSETAPNTSSQTRSLVFAALEITDDTAFYRLEHYIEASAGVTDLGKAASANNTTPFASHREIYAYGFFIQL